MAALGILMVSVVPVQVRAKSVLDFFTTAAVYEALLSNIDGGVMPCDVSRRKGAVWVQKRDEIERRALAAEALFPPGDEQKAVRDIRHRYDDGEWTPIYESATRISRSCTEADLKALDDNFRYLATLLKAFESRAQQYQR